MRIRNQPEHMMHYISILNSECAQARIKSVESSFDLYSPPQSFDQSTESPILFRSCGHETPFSDQKRGIKIRDSVLYIRPCARTQPIRQLGPYMRCCNYCRDIYENPDYQTQNPHAVSPCSKIRNLRCYCSSCGCECTTQSNLT